MANAFMCKIEKQLERENKLPIFYKRFVDDTLIAMPDDYIEKAKSKEKLSFSCSVLICQ